MRKQQVKLSQEDRLAAIAFQVMDNNDEVTNRALEMGDSAALLDFLKHCCCRIRNVRTVAQAEDELLLCVARLRTAASRLADC